MMRPRPRRPFGAPPQIWPPPIAGDPAPVWPLVGVAPRVRPESFGNDRPGRHHAGIDVLAPRGTIVLAPEAGELVRQQAGFAGKDAAGLLLQTDTGPVVNLGEVIPDSFAEFGLSLGSRVVKGQPVARVGDPGKPGGDTMLHFELYAPGTRKTSQWRRGEPPPPSLRDPRPYLQLAAQHPIPASAPTPGAPPAGDPLRDQWRPLEPPEPAPWSPAEPRPAPAPWPPPEPRPAPWSPPEPAPWPPAAPSSSSSVLPIVLLVGALAYLSSSS